MSTLPTVPEPERLNPSAAPSTAKLVEPPPEILTFTLGSEDYGIDILQVQEIRGYAGVTRMPDAPSWLKGVINLRGTIIPVIDLRIKLHIGEARYDDTTVMIVVNVGSRTIGLVVDAVSDVTRLQANQISRTPAMGSAIDETLIKGIASVGQRMIILFDIQALLGSASDFAAPPHAALAAVA